MLFSNRTLQSAENPPFQQADDTMAVRQRRILLNHAYRIKRRCLSLPPRTGDNVRETFFGEFRIAAPCVGDYRRAVLHQLPDGVGKRSGRDVGNDKESCPSDDRTAAFRCLSLRRDHDDVLSEGPAALASFAFPAYIRFVHLHYAGQFLPSRTHHRLAELVKAEPCRGIGEARRALETQCAVAVFLKTDVPHDPEPGQERRVRVLKDSS